MTAAVFWWSATAFLALAALVCAMLSGSFYTEADRLSRADTLEQARAFSAAAVVLVALALWVRP